MFSQQTGWALLFKEKFRCGSHKRSKNYLPAITSNANGAERGAVGTNEASDGTGSGAEEANNCLPGFTVVRCGRLAALHFTNITFVSGGSGRSEDGEDSDSEDGELGEHYERM